MSFEALGFVTGHLFVKGCTLSPVERLTLISVAAAADAHGEGAFPGLVYLEETTGASRKTVQRSLASLAARGLLEDTGDRRGQTGRVVVWRMLLPAGTSRAAWPKHHQWRHRDLITPPAAESPMVSPVPDSPPSNEVMVTGLNEVTVTGLEPANGVNDDTQSGHPRHSRSLSEPVKEPKRRDLRSLAVPADLQQLLILPPDQLRTTLEETGWVESPDTPWIYTRTDSRPLDLIEAALIEVRGMRRKDITDQNWPSLAKAAQMIRRTDASPLEVIRRGSRFARARRFRPTPMELASKWAEWGDAADDRFASGDTRHQEAVARAARVVSG